MAKRDARKQAAQTSSKPRRSKSSPVIFRGWFWLALGILFALLGTGLGILTVLPKFSGMFHAASHGIPIETAIPVELPHAVAAQKKLAPPPPPLTIIFESAPPITEPLHYWLSYGIYPPGDDLTALAATLTAAHQTFREAPLRQQGVLVYRVESGPYDNLDDACAAQLLLLQKKINAIVRLAV